MYVIIISAEKHQRMGLADCLAKCTGFESRYVNFKIARENQLKY